MPYRVPFSTISRSSGYGLHSARSGRVRARRNGEGPASSDAEIRHHRVRQVVELFGIRPRCRSIAYRHILHPRFRASMCLLQGKIKGINFNKLNCFLNRRPGVETFVPAPLGAGRAAERGQFGHGAAGLRGERDRGSEGGGGSTRPARRPPFPRDRVRPRKTAV